jgi:hypothetical protein
MKVGIFALVVILGTGVFGAETKFAWQEEGSYRAPDFEGTFPLDAEGGKRLERAWVEFERSGSGDEKVFEAVRQGLRGLRVDRQMPVLRWFGNEFIWNKSPQDPRAIELMYHASGSTNSVISYNAIYFGLSVVRPKTQPILQAMVEAGMRSEDPNVLSRIAWGAAAEKEALLRYLAPYLESEDAKVREHAEALRQIFSGEVKAFAWAEARAKRAAQDKYSGRLEEIRGVLRDGNSAARREILELIQDERIGLIMDETFVPAFAAAAEDEDMKVRKLATRVVGSRWVWGSTNQSAGAIDLMMRSSRDADREVRYDAMYYGLSTVAKRSDEVVERMIEMVMLDGMDDRNFRQRVTWSLKNEKETVRRALEKWIRGDDVVKGLFAYGFHSDFLGERPAVESGVTELAKTPGVEVAHLVGMGPTQGWKAKSTDEFYGAFRDELGAATGERMLWMNENGPPFVIVPKSESRAIFQALATSARFKVLFQYTLTVAQLVQIGKEGGLKGLNLK